METDLRTALIEWLRADPALSARVNTVEEEAPLRAAAPWLGIAASASTDWGTKDRCGREVRLALELHCRGDDPAACAEAVHAIEMRIEAMPPIQPGFAIASCTFLRGRAERRPGNIRAVLIEYRFRLLSHP
ncbi:conserved hypothetical protein [Altererythrobacter sp. B11]|uniref:DUF3168 domain-containing protein n=1 Tax=Altererythrobacter sp. B11 TaxID=2060312 RepID=UPI000DC74056|nr:DUF3168 domain-containing protein [Altererythrobacter sp. B11]BBC71597.1 conserved hypothetical protein [Altererythrobacter sp. B11]